MLRVLLEITITAVFMVTWCILCMRILNHFQHFLFFRHLPEDSSSNVELKARIKARSLIKSNPDIRKVYDELKLLARPGLTEKALLRRSLLLQKLRYLVKDRVVHRQIVILSCAEKR